MAERKEIQSFHSSPKQMEEFIKFSPIWKDMREELLIWLGDSHMLLENPDCVLKHQDLDQLGGRTRTIREVLTLPEIILGLMKIKKH